MENLLLSVHNLLRWAVLIAGVWAFVAAVTGITGKKPFTANDNRIGLLFTLFMHLQILLGLLIYFVTSPMMKVIFNDFGAAMKNSEMRFWAVEHILAMIIAAVIITIGRSKSKKAADDLAKHKKAAIFYGIGLLLILMMIPWPFGAHIRPWLRF